jgi:hypothetical protein
MSGLLGGKPVDFANVNVDGWVSDWSIGSAQADPYVRARVARHGLLALTKDEAVYFTKAVDGEGNRLSENCVYEVSGGAQDAYWWSITLYDGRSLLPMNTDLALSIDATSATDRYGDAPWSVTVSRKRPEGDGLWLSSKAAGNFDLMLRLYRASDALLADPAAHVNPPTISKISCEGASP